MKRPAVPSAAPTVDRQPKRSRGAHKPSNNADGGEAEELDPSILDRMVDFLDGHGGAFDYGRFGAEFAGVKKRQLEPHFDFVQLDDRAGGRWEIRLPGAGGSASSASREQGRSARGSILFYDKAKGYGFINTPDYPGDDIFFPRASLPRGLQESRGDDIRGLEVDFEFFIKEDGKPRADKIGVVGSMGPPGTGRGDNLGSLSSGGSSPSSIHSRMRPGRIARYDKGKGYGFIKCPDLSEDVFFLPSVLPKELTTFDGIEVEEVEVEVEPATQAGKKPRALQIVLTRMRPRGAAPPRPPQEGSVHLGTVISYDAIKAFGFVKPDDIGEDVFFLRAEMPPEIQAAGRDQVVDCRVEFEVKTMPDGKLRAQRMLLLSGMGGAPPPPPMMHRGAPAPPLPPMAMPMPTPHRQAMPMPMGVPMGVPMAMAGRPIGPQGLIRGFDRQKGYGFVQVPGQQEDIFFLPSALPPDMRSCAEDLNGIQVHVDYFVNPDGKPRAKQVQPIPHSQLNNRPGGLPGAPPLPMPMPMPMPMAMAMGAAMNQMGMKIPGMGGMPMPMGVPMGNMMQQQEKMYIGEFVRFDVAKGFGFITPDGMSEDVFCLRSEMPPEMRDAQTKEEVIGQRVEFEVKEMPDGKLRAKNVSMNAPRRSYGRIHKFEDGKGYGFIKSPSVPDTNVFFLMSTLPKELKETIDRGTGADILETSVSFDLGQNEHGKPRANNILVEDQPPPPVGKEAGKNRTDVQNGDVLTGVIVRYNKEKAFGFVKPDEIDEDVFFLRSEMPAEMKENADSWPLDQIEQQRVEFEVMVKPDGKLRAQRLEHLGPAEKGDEPTAASSRDAELAPLEESLVLEMEDFLEQQGGGSDYGRFASHFSKVKRKQLEEHFLIIPSAKGRGGPGRIELPEGHPGKPAAGSVTDEPAPEDVAMDSESAPPQEVDPDNEPAIPPCPGCQPQGVIHQYDPSKGFGFIKVDGFDQDIFFPRISLPDNFQGRKREEMPELVGVHVAFDLKDSSDRGPRADKVSLMLRYEAEDRCWLLKRS